MKPASNRSIKGCLIALFVFILSSCSWMDQISYEDDEPARAYIKSSSATWQIFDLSPETKTIEPVEAWLEVGTRGEDNADIRIFYLFKTQHEFYPFDGTIIQGSCEILLKDVPFKRKSGKMVFDVSGVRSSIKLAIVDDELEYSDVKVSGSLNMSKINLGADLSVSGMVKDRPFGIKVDALSKTKPDYSPEICVVVDYYTFADLIIRNNTAHRMKVDLTSKAPGIKTTTINIDPMDKHQGYYPLYEQLLYYTDIVITTDDGKKTTVDTGGWKPFYKQDDYFLFYDMEGEIRPYYYYIFSVDIDEQLFDQASDD